MSHGFSSPHGSHLYKERREVTHPSWTMPTVGFPDRNQRHRFRTRCLKHFSLRHVIISGRRQPSSEKFLWHQRWATLAAADDISLNLTRPRRGHCMLLPSRFAPQLSTSKTRFMRASAVSRNTKDHGLSNHGAPPSHWWSSL